MTRVWCGMAVGSNAEERSVRPVFFAPWWWFVWSSGKRFSLRRALSLAVGIILAAEIVVSGFRYAFRGEMPTPNSALSIGAFSGAASLAYSLVEPLFVIVRDSVASGRLRPERLRDVSYGLQTAYAAGLGYVSFALAPHVPTLATLLARARDASGEAGGDARFLIGATIVFLPLVIAARFLALQVRPPIARAVIGRPQRTIPPIDRSKIPAQPMPPQIPVRPARIVNVEIGPVEPGDRT